MPHLKLKCTLQNLTDLRPTDTPESPFEYTFRIQCTSCRETHDKEITINRFEQHDISGSRGEANFVFKCKMCKRESTASITATGVAYTAEDSEEGKWVKLLDVECRGLEIEEFIPQGNFEASGLKGFKFHEVDLSEGEFYDYDEDQGEEVSITEVQWVVDRT